MARRVHFLGMLASIVAVCLLSFCLMSGTGVFVLKESFYKRVETHGAKYGFDRSYGIGLLKDSEGHGWMNEETLLSIDGCTDHAIKGENAGWFALAGTALAALCVVVHPVGVFYDKCMLRFVLSLLCGFSSVCCGLSFWFLLSIYQDPMPCTRGIDDFNNSTDVDNVALSNVFDRSIVFPLLIVAGGLCAVSGLVMLISVLCCFKVCPANDGYNASVEKDIELKEISQINEESHTQEGVNEQNPQVLEPMISLQRVITLDLKVHLLGLCSAVASVVLIGGALHSGSSAFTLRAHFRDVFAHRGGWRGLDQNYAMGLAHDSRGNAWGGSGHLMEVEGCAQHSFRGRVGMVVGGSAAGLAAAAAALHTAALCGKTHRKLRLAAAATTAMYGLCCLVEAWLLLSLYQDSLPCSRKAHNGIGGAMAVTVALSLRGSFRLGAAFPVAVLCVVLSGSSLLAVAVRVWGGQRSGEVYLHEEVDCAGIETRVVAVGSADAEGQQKHQQDRREVVPQVGTPGGVQAQPQQCSRRGSAARDATVCPDGAPPTA